MTTRNLDHLVSPKSVAVIGASDARDSLGRVIMSNLVSAGFHGAIWPVNPKYDHVAGLRCYRGIEEIDGVPDLAVIATPSPTIPGIIEQLGRKGTRAAVVVTAGLNDTNGLRQKMLDAAKPYLLRIVGPNTVGINIPAIGLNASFAHLSATPGHIALLSQSGAIMTSLMDWAADNNVGFSHVISLGDMADVDAADFLDLLATDPATKAIVMYLESMPNPRKFISAARAATRFKPVVAIKAGRHPEAAKAAATHTGALSSGDRVTDALLRRAGILRIDDIGELFAAVETVGRFQPHRRPRVTIVTNGGGAGVLLMDQLLDRSHELARLSDITLASLGQVLPENWSKANPVDIIGDAPPQRYREALTRAAADPSSDIVVVMNCPTGIASPVLAAEAVAGLASEGKIGGKPVLACWLGGRYAREGRAVLSQNGISTYETPAEVASAIRYLTDWAAAQESLVSAPRQIGSPKPDHALVREIFRNAASEGRRILTEIESKAVIGEYGIRVPETVLAKTPEEAGAAAERLLSRSSRVAVKLHSKTLTHKSDFGGVVLGVETSEGARDAAVKIAENLLRHGKSGQLQGFAVQEMVERKHAHELILGLTCDRLVGPVVMFGSGGVSVEVVDDTAVALPPLDEALALELINRTRVSRLLAGYRDRPPAQRPAIVDALCGLSQIAVDFPCVVAVDINPLLADQAGVIALDARIEIEPGEVARPGPNPRLAIKPVPEAWDRKINARDGRQLAVRPVIPSDGGLFADFTQDADLSDLRLRLSPLPPSQQELVRLTQIDYDREMSFVALQEQGGLAAIARLAADPDRERAEFSIAVRRDLQGRGIGSALLAHLLDYASAEKIRSVEGFVPLRNIRMLKVCEELGFVRNTSPKEPDWVVLHLDLPPEPRVKATLRAV